MDIQTYASIAQNNFDRIWAILEENSKQLKESNKQFIEIGERFRETDARMKETDRMLSEKFRETNKQIGKLTHSWGEFVEGIVKPSVVKMFNERNIDIERVTSRSTSHKGGDTMEIDLLADNGSYVVAIEAKSKLLSENIIEFAKNLKKFKYFFPLYADKKVIGAVAGITIDISVKKLAEKKGLFIIAQKGEMVEIINEPDFEPNFW